MLASPAMDLGVGVVELDLLAASATSRSMLDEPPKPKEGIRNLFVAAVARRLLLLALPILLTILLPEDEKGRRACVGAGLNCLALTEASWPCLDGSGGGCMLLAGEAGRRLCLPTLPKEDSEEREN